MTTKLTKFGAKIQLVERATLIFSRSDKGVEDSFVQEMTDILVEEGWRVNFVGPHKEKDLAQGVKSVYVLERLVGEGS